MSEPQLDALFREALSSIARLMRADAVSLLLANDEGTELIGRAAFGLSREVDLTVSIPAGAGVSEGCFRQANPLRRRPARDGGRERGAPLERPALLCRRGTLRR